MAWTIDYTDTAKTQLRKLDKNSARRIMDYMDERIAGADPRRVGQALAGPLGKLWRYRVGDFRVVCDIQDDAVRVLVVRVGKRDRVYRRADADAMMPLYSSRADADAMMPLYSSKADAANW